MRKGSFREKARLGIIDKRLDEPPPGILSGEGRLHTDSDYSPPEDLTSAAIDVWPRLTAALLVAAVGIALALLGSLYVRAVGALLLAAALGVTVLVLFRQRRALAEAATRAQVLEGLRNALARSPSLHDVLEAGVQAVLDITGGLAGLSATREESAPGYEIAANWGFGRDVLDEGAQRLIGAGPLESIVTSGRPVMVDLNGGDFLQSSLAAAGHEWVWLVPVRSGDIRGALLAAGPGEPSLLADSAFLSSVARDVGWAATTAVLHARESERARLMTILADFASVAVTLVEEDQVRQAATAALTAMFPEESGYVTSLQSGGGNLLITETFGPSEERAARIAGLRGSEECPEMSGCRAIVRGGVYEGIGDGGLWDCPYRKSPDGLAPSFACSPVISADAPLGAVHVARPVSLPFQEEEREALAAVGLQLGLAISNARLLRTTREQAVRDPMTGLHNYRFLIEYLQTQGATAKRHGNPLSLLMLDIDHFRDFNNLFGHAAGDHVLRTLAKILTTHVRGSDLAARYGGEEFTVVLPATDAQGAFRVAESIRKGVEQAELMFGGRDLGKLQVSVGVATMPRNASTTEELIRRADAALYEAKEAGRNQVKSA